MIFEIKIYFFIYWFISSSSFICSSEKMENHLNYYIKHNFYIFSCNLFGIGSDFSTLHKFTYRVAITLQHFEMAKNEIKR